MINIIGKSHSNLRPFFCFYCHIFLPEPGGGNSFHPAHPFFYKMNEKLKQERSMRNIKQTPLKRFFVFNLRVNFVFQDLDVQFAHTGTFEKVGRVRSGDLARPTAFNIVNLTMNCRMLHALIFIDRLLTAQNQTTKKNRPGCSMERPYRFFYRPPHHGRPGA